MLPVMVVLERMVNGDNLGDDNPQPHDDDEGEPLNGLPGQDDTGMIIFNNLSIAIDRLVCLRDPPTCPHPTPRSVNPIPSMVPIPKSSALSVDLGCLCTSYCLIGHFFGDYFSCFPLWLIR